MQHKSLLSLVLAACMLMASSCATISGHGVTSPYFRPEPGVLYRYGNFCGPDFPVFGTPPETDVEARIATIQRVAPIDDIDQACRIHDLCYEFLGHDASDCDFLLGTSLTGLFRLLVDANPERGEMEQQCRDLANEVANGVVALKGRRHSDTPIADPIVNNYARMTMLPASLGLHALTVGWYGWPEPGECVAEPDARRLAQDRAYNQFLQYLADEYCDESGVNAERFQACMDERMVQLRGALGLDDMLGDTALSLERFEATMCQGLQGARRVSCAAR